MRAADDLVVLEEAGLVRHVLSLELEYLFRHALIQEAAYASLLRHSRHNIHRAIAQTYERDFQQHLDEHAAVIAFHFEQAGEIERAVSYLWRAGEFALRHSALAEADAAFERATILLPAGDLRRPTLLVRRADVALLHSDYATATTLLQESLALAHNTNDLSAISKALSGLTRVASQQGEHAEARRRGEDAVQAARQCGDVTALAMALRRLAIANDYLGEVATAADLLQESASLYRGLGDTEGVSACLNSLGILAIERRDLEQAETFVSEALNLSNERGDLHAVGTRLTNLGTIAYERGDLPRATHYQQEALAVARRIGDREGVALTTLNLGSLALKQGEIAAAFANFRAALTQAVALESYALAVYVIAAIADAHVRLKDFRRGAELLGFALNHPACTGDIRIDFANSLEMLQTALPVVDLDALMRHDNPANLSAVVESLLAAEQEPS